MTRILRISLLVAAVCILSATSALAAPITYTYTGVGSGQLGQNSFFDVFFEINALADTNNVGPWCCSARQNTHINTTIVIQGLGLHTILTPSHTWNHPGQGGIGQNLGANWITLFEAGMGAHDLASNVGPILENDPAHVNQFNNVATSGGSLTFNSIDHVTFRARTQVPEPTTLLLLGTGLTRLVMLRRRK